MHRVGTALRCSAGEIALVARAFAHPTKSCIGQLKRKLQDMLQTRMSYFGKPASTFPGHARAQKQEPLALSEAACPHRGHWRLSDLRG
jgi:hypothetical protein